MIGFCAPMVSQPLMKALVLEESRGHPFAIHDGVTHRALFPSTKEQAVETARKLLSGGSRIDAGLAQINSDNWESLGLTAQTVFDPCINLQAGERVLLKAYLTSPHTQDAAISRYNTGHPRRGVKNGYVARVKKWISEPQPGISYETSVTLPSDISPTTELPSPPKEAAPKATEEELRPINRFQFKLMSDGFVRGENSPNSPELK